MQVHKPENATAVAFKNEAIDRGQAVGPVYFKLEDDSLVPAIEDGRHFDGSPAAMWLRRIDADAMAAHFDVEMEEL